MEENLQLLMDVYEEEKSNLEEIIRQFLSEDELKYAYYHRKALMKLNKKIDTLKTLENPFFFLTEMQQKLIKMWEDKLNEAGLVGRPTDFILQNLEHHRRELAKLETELMNSKKFKTENILEQALSELLANKIRYLKLHFTRKETFYFKFTFTGTTLDITIPFIKMLLISYIRKRNVKALINLGFVLSKNGNKLKIKLKGDNEQIIAKFNVLFSRIIFDVFYVNEFKNESVIEFGPPV